VNVDFHPAAERELLDAVQYYNDQRPDLGYEFAAEVEEAVNRVRAHPEGWAWVSERDDLRRCQTKRFPYRLIYQVQPNRVLILAVAHLKRRPGYWRDRLP
jgi:mRNA-degrading endonuclease RelE of RelBE toxin-antitoxin system